VALNPRFVGEKSRDIGAVVNAECDGLPVWAVYVQSCGVVVVSPNAGTDKAVFAVQHVAAGRLGRQSQSVSLACFG
jgi:hypothetical protein